MNKPDGWGEFYAEFILGFEYPSEYSCTCRNDAETIFFFGSAGVVTVQKIATLEFDGWEIWSTWTDPVRYESVNRARVCVVTIFGELAEVAS